ncbi:MAG: 23S rRNA (adenine(2503)-C(2))-methyltransferase RlmN [Clostridium sp.]
MDSLLQSFQKKESKVDLRDLTIDEIKVYLQEIGEKPFRAKQIFKWIHKSIEDIDDMSDLSKDLREKLKKDAYICNMNIVGKLESKIDGTIKYLMSMKDGNVIECVFMKYKHGNSICISTQAGCRMGCTFCASTIGGKNRDLTAGEMLGQILKVQLDTGESISNIVLMGTGEPFDNYDNVMKFLSLVNCSEGVNIGMRHITISTCGLVPEIKRLAEDNNQVTLAISLHSPYDEARKQIMPIARKYSLDELMEACRYYISKTSRRITFEYSLIDGVNDHKEYASELVCLLSGMLCHVNLIPINQVKERDYKKSNKKRVDEFKAILERGGISTTVRRELGSDIDAACGQLRRQYLNKLD